MLSKGGLVHWGIMGKDEHAFYWESEATLCDDVSAIKAEKTVHTKLLLSTDVILNNLFCLDRI